MVVTSPLRSVSTTRETTANFGSMVSDLRKQGFHLTALRRQLGYPRAIVRKELSAKEDVCQTLPRDVAHHQASDAVEIPCFGAHIDNTFLTAISAKAPYFPKAQTRSAWGCCIPNGVVWVRHTTFCRVTPNDG